MRRRRYKPTSKKNTGEGLFFKPKIQTKLSMGKAGDKYEVEADKMADQVVHKTGNAEGIQKMENEEEVQQKSLAASVTPVLQKMEQEEPLQAMGEDETVQKMEQEEPLQAMEEDEIAQKMEQEEPLQAMEEDEIAQKMEQEEPLQALEEDEVAQKMEQEEPLQAMEEDETVQTKTNHKPSQKTSIEGKLRKGSGGSQMDPHTQAEMEAGFGADFSNIKIHADTEAAQMSQGIGAQAFTNGNDVYFNKNKYNPNTKEGKHLLAHELTHTIQQGKSEPKNNISPSGNNIQKQNTSPNVVAMTDTDIRNEIVRLEAELASNNSSTEGSNDVQVRLDILRREETERTALAPRLNAITATYNAMIRDARSQGYPVAADNLQHFLTGNGSTRTLGVSWLRGFDAVTSAEQTNQNRFQNSLHDIAENMADGATRNFSDHWDKRLTGSVFTELYYASGTSTITSTGAFTLTRNGDTVTISGSVNHRWWDPYDWHANLSAFIPGHGSISDADALLLQRYRQAMPFLMESNWTQTLSGTIEIINLWPDTVNLTWTGP